MEGFTPQEGQVVAPKLTLELTHQLNEPMEKLSMRRAFSGGEAHFNEQGTEAAAVTAVIMDEGMPKPLLVADRPFLRAIGDDQTGLLLFIGTVVDP